MNSTNCDKDNREFITIILNFVATVLTLLLGIYSQRKKLIKNYDLECSDCFKLKYNSDSNN
jgi:hypothetical protein